VFRSQSMTWVEMVVPERDIVPMTEALAGTHVFHVAEPAGPAAETGLFQRSIWDTRANRYTALMHRIVDVMALFGVEAGAPPGATAHLISPDLAERDIETLELEVKGPAEELAEARERLDRLRHVRAQVLPLAGLDITVEAFRESVYLFAVLGTMPVDNVSRLERSLEHLPSVLVVLRERGHLATVALFGMNRDTELLTRAARSAYLTPTELPEEYTGTPDQVLHALDESIRRAREHVMTVESTLHHLHEIRLRRLRHLLWRVRASLKLVQTIAGFRTLRQAYLVTGWVPSKSVEQLLTVVSAVSSDTVVELRVPTPEEQADAPFVFANPPFIRLFQQLVTIYGHPAYSELDPTPLVALSFPLMFGMMFGDVGHGLLMVGLGSLLLSRKVRALKGAAGFGGIVVACGALATLFGFLYGSLFGFEDVLPALWLRPLERTQDILLVSVAFGMVMITVGMLYHVIGAAVRKEWGKVLFDRHGIAGIVFYWSLVGLAAGFLLPAMPISARVLGGLAGVSGLAIALSSRLAPLVDRRATVPVDSRIAHEGSASLVEGFFELFEAVLGALSNTLSYVRIGAFAVAHGALSLVVFILANMVDARQGVGYWVVVALGNLVVIGFEGMIVAIQTLRLEYYELFSKFFAAGGWRFRPFALLDGEES
jgi:V/A-type H+/Na+-transporting ATPase subunit I